MVTEEDVRRAALSLPGSAEKPYDQLPPSGYTAPCSSAYTSCPTPFSFPAAAWRSATNCSTPTRVRSSITPHYQGYPEVLVRLSQFDFRRDIELVTEGWRRPKRVLAAYDAEYLI
jgi:hypothetical protein